MTVTWHSATAQVALQNALGIAIEDPQRLCQACTHASTLPAELSAAERRRRSNERFEFLGDLVVALAVGEDLMTRFPDQDEDFLSQHKAHLVSRRSLAKAWREHDLVPVARVAAHLRPPLPDSILANVAEGVIGAIYHERGYAAAAAAVRRLLARALAAITPRSDAQTVAGSLKNHLQHLAQAAGEAIPSYRTERSGGPDHAPSFTSSVTVCGHTAEGHGASRKAAETLAAQRLIALLEPPA